MVAKRLIFRVQYVSKGAIWRLITSAGIVHQWHVNKATVVRFARKTARLEKPSQLIVHGKNGRIQFEHTYGSDPRKSRG